jgi:dUTP pyrophosphatase
MIVKFKKLNPEAKLPAYHTAGASGFDLAALKDTVIPSGETMIVKTGLAVELPTAGPVLYEMQVRPRGGTSLKTPIRIANSPGTVDVDYRGEIGIIVTNTKKDDSLIIKAGQRIAQGVICPVVQCLIEEAKELTETKRDTGAYNSTGVN